MLSPFINRHYAIIEDGYIRAVGIGDGWKEITAEEYDNILSVIASKPKETEIIGYSLKEDLTWEEFQKPPIPPEPENADPERILGVLLGEET